MKQYKLMQVALLAILLFGWAGCSQNEEEVPGNVRNGIVLNVTDTGIISNEPSTRTEDTGFVTTFTQGDQIGLFAVKDGAILDEINNMPFTFNGSSWSGKPILYDDRLVGVWSQVRILSSRLLEISHLQLSKWLIYFLVEHIWNTNYK